jgi:hypothetical protein
MMLAFAPSRSTSAIRSSLLNELASFFFSQLNCVVKRPISA